MVAPGADVEQVADDYTVKVADFGLSKATSGKSLNSKVGSLNWCAPEILLRRAAYTPQSDVYSFGMVLYELVVRARRSQSLVVDASRGPQPRCHVHLVIWVFSLAAVMSIPKPTWSCDEFVPSGEVVCLVCLVCASVYPVRYVQCYRCLVISFPDGARAIREHEPSAGCACHRFWQPPSTTARDR